MKKYYPASTTEVVTKVPTETLGRVDEFLGQTTKHFDSFARPIRTTFAERYPTLFLLLGTFGLSATFLGIEQVLLANAFLQQHPTIILALGVLTLAFTGTLYKKLK